MSNLSWNHACYDQLKHILETLDGTGAIDIRVARSGGLSGEYRGCGILIENIDNRVRAMIRAQVVEQMDSLREKIKKDVDAL